MKDKTNSDVNDSSNEEKTLAKKGGPYTADQREKRRLEVFKLHFEEGHSIVETAKRLGIHRNTISEDCRNWYYELAKHWKDYDREVMIVKQFQRIEEQHARLLKSIQNEKDSKQKLALEKMLNKINEQLMNHVRRTMENKTGDFRREFSDIDDQTVKELVRFLILDYSHDKSIYNREDIECGIIYKTGCDNSFVDKVLHRMFQLGLGNHKVTQLTPQFGRFSPDYDLVRFAEMRHYITKNEATKIMRQ